MEAAEGGATFRERQDLQFVLFTEEVFPDEAECRRLWEKATKSLSLLRIHLQALTILSAGDPVEEEAWEATYAKVQRMEQRLYELSIPERRGRNTPVKNGPDRP